MNIYILAHINISREQYKQFLLKNTEFHVP